MAEVVYGDQAIPAPLQQLVRVMQSDGFDGTLYLGYPILTNVEGTVRVDALYVSQVAGVVLFDASHLNLNANDKNEATQLERAQDRFFAAIQSKLLETPELLVKRKLAVPITVISLSTNLNRRLGEALVATPERIRSNIPRDANLSEAQYKILNSVIERTATIRPKKRRANVTKSNSRGAILKELERHIANLDGWQKRAAIETPAGPQRIRGLAGSGKTIVLALKAAFLHSKYPDWRIVLTFQTRSLYQQFRRLVRQFCFEFSKQEPDWEKLTVLHAWGSSSSRGVYSDIARALGSPAADYNSAKSRYGTATAFEGICAELLATAKSLPATPIFDAVLIDEAQDLPQSFFELIYVMTNQPKQIVYAYDELQNLSDFDMRPAEELFGKKANGRPNVQLKNVPDRPRRDIILPVCYRNTPWTLSIAHGLGFGTAREAGLIQMFDEPGLWNEIGYDVVDGQLASGKEVALHRSPSATPTFFGDLISPEDAVQFVRFDSASDEIEWLAGSIKTNLKQEELEHDDILIVIPEALTIRAAAARIMKGLRAHGIGTHLVGVTASRDEVFAPDSIAITSVYRAKGNEAPMVYVVGSDYCQGGFNLARKRNILFTAITRSRAWTRVSGVGERMADLVAEYQRIVHQQYDLRFQYPTSAELKKLRTLHRDRSSDEITEIQRDIDGLSRLLARVESGEVSLDALPLEAQSLVKRLSDENSKSAKSGRKADR